MIIAKEKSMGLWYLDSEIVERIFFFKVKSSSKTRSFVA